MNHKLAYKADISSLRSIHIFNDELEKYLNEIKSPEFECQIHYNFIENCGPHWNGFRCFLMDNKNRSLYYLHIGLIFHPDTKKGIMVELDRASNSNTYKKIRNNIKEGRLYELNKDETNYLKLFLNEKKLEKANKSNKIEIQLKIIKDFLLEALTAIIRGGRE